MGFDRSTLYRGPGTITFDGATIHSETDIVAEMSRDLFEVVSTGFGRVSRRTRNKFVRVTCKPNMWDSLTKILPYASTQLGAGIYGASDLPLVINPKTGNGSKITIVNAAVTRLPNLNFSAVNSQIGEMEFIGLVGNNLDADDPASYFAFAAADGTLAGFDLTKIKNEVYTMTRNAIAYKSREGFQVEWEMELEDDAPDGFGVVQKYLQGFEARLRFIPSGLLEDHATNPDLTGLLAFSEQIGAEPAKFACAIAGSGGVAFTLNNAIVDTARTGYGRQSPRTGEITFASVRSQTAGTLDALFTAA